MENFQKQNLRTVRTVFSFNEQKCKNTENNNLSFSVFLFSLFLSHTHQNLRVEEFFNNKIYSNQIHLLDLHGSIPKKILRKKVQIPKPKRIKIKKKI